MEKIDFFIVGAQKSATTSLYNYLLNSKDIAGHAQRELAYFLLDDSYKKGSSYMLKTFYPKYNNESFLLAKHAMLMYSEKALKRLKDYNSDIKIVIVVRDPVDRAYSAFWYAKRRGWEKSKSFKEALEKEDERVKSNWEKYRNNAYIYNGLYGIHLSNVLKYFPSESIAIVDQKTLKVDTTSVIKKVCEFLKIDQPETLNNQAYNRSAIARYQVFANFTAWLFAKGNPFKKAFKFVFPNSKTLSFKNKILKLNEKEFSPPILETNIRSQLELNFSEDQKLFNEIIQTNKITYI